MTASQDTSYIADELRSRLTVCRESKHADYFMALCPAHPNTDPKSPALSVQLHHDGVGVKCHGNPPCSTGEILAAVGMTKADLFVKAELVDDGAPPAEASRTNGHAKPAARERRRGRLGKRDVAYEYRDADGKTIFRVVRTPDKSFFQHTIDAEGKWWTGLDVDPVLYRLPELLAADPGEPVFVVEGEKDADRLAELGLVATTSHMGAGKWRAEYARFLRGRTVYVVPDNDDPGRRHAEQIAASL